LQVPQVLPAIRRVFALAAASAFLAWALASLFLSLVPSYIIQLLHTPTLALIGAIAALMLACSAIVQLAAPRLAPLPAQRIGMALVASAAGALLVTAELRSLVAIVAAGALAGCGLGFAFRGSLQDVSAIAPVEAKGNVVAAFYIVVYLGTAIPVIGVGVLAQATGLVPAVRIFDYVIGAACLAQLLALSTGSFRR
jgi:hypothetical protein